MQKIEQLNKSLNQEITDLKQLNESLSQEITKNEQLNQRIVKIESMFPKMLRITGPPDNDIARIL